MPRHSSSEAQPAIGRPPDRSGRLFRVADFMVAGILLSAAWNKVMTPGPSVNAVAALIWGLGEFAAYLSIGVVFLVITLEGVIAASLVSSTRHRSNRRAAAIVFVLFTGFLFVHHAFGTGQDCGCFARTVVGSPLKESLPWRILGNSTLASVMFAGSLRRWG